MGRSAWLVLLLVLGCGSRGPETGGFDGDEFDWRFSEKQNGVDDWLEYLQKPRAKAWADKAHARIAELRGTARRSITGWKEEAVMATLLVALAGRNDPTVAVIVEPPSATSLEEVDRMIAERSPRDRPIAPIGKHFQKTHERALATALNEELTRALGVRAIVFKPMVPFAGQPILRVAWSARGTNRLFSAPNNERQYVGVAIDCKVTVEVPEHAPVELTAAVEPEEEFTSETNPFSTISSMQHPEWDTIDDDVYAGMAESAFRRLSLALLARLSGKPAAPPKSTPAVERMRKLCDEDKDGTACVALAHAHLAGEGVPVDKARAAELLKTPCLLGTRDACVPLAWLHLRGDGVEKNEARAANMLERDCEAPRQNGEACELHGRVLERDPELVSGDRKPGPEWAVVDYVKACDLGRGTACARAARLWDGGALGRDQARAAVLHRRACAAGEKASCARAKALGKPRAKEVFGYVLPKSAELFDVRWEQIYRGSGEVVVWVTGDTGPGETVTIRTWDVADTQRPTTVAPPAGVTRISRLAPHAAYERCPGCPIPPGVSDFGCECMP